MRALGASLSGADVWGVAKLMNHLVLISLNVRISAANRLIGEVVQSQRRPLLGPSPG